MGLSGPIISVLISVVTSLTHVDSLDSVATSLSTVVVRFVLRYSYDPMM